MNVSPPVVLRVGGVVDLLLVGRAVRQARRQRQQVLQQ